MDVIPGKNTLPGVTAPVFTASREFRKQKLQDEAKFGVVIDDASRDAGNVPVTTLRPGLVLVRVEAAGALQGMFVPSTHASAPLAADVEMSGILNEYVNMIESTGVAADKSAHIVRMGVADYAQLIWDTVDPVLIDSLRDAMPLVDVIEAP
jgi:hypothetical protein